MMDTPGLPLPAARCLSKDQAAAYLGIGATLFDQLGVPCVFLGRRRVYDKVDLDAWLDDHKGERRRARKEDSQWPVTKVCIGDRIPASGGSTPRSPTASAYAKALGLNTEKKPRRCLPNASSTPTASIISALSPSDPGKKLLSGISN
uniref:Helix-turn-helix domain-containing protein n=1 Tax=mine drainage metagenome TaxID=410659 RepID=E6PTM1_9ZZZZ